MLYSSSARVFFYRPVLLGTQFPFTLSCLPRSELGMKAPSTKPDNNQGFSIQLLFILPTSGTFPLTQPISLTFMPYGTKLLKEANSRQDKSVLCNFPCTVSSQSRSLGYITFPRCLLRGQITKRPWWTMSPWTILVHHLSKPMACQFHLVILSGLLEMVPSHRSLSFLRPSLVCSTRRVPTTYH